MNLSKNLKFNRTTRLTECLKLRLFFFFSKKNTKGSSEEANTYHMGTNIL